MALNLKNYDFKKIALVADIVIVFIVIIGVLTTPDVTDKNTTLVNGHYDNIEKEVYKGDTSYNLYIKRIETFIKYLPTIQNAL